MSKISILLVLVAVAVIAGFVVWKMQSGKAGAATPLTNAYGTVGNGTAAGAPSATPAPGASAGATTPQKIASATLHTNKGDITIQFSPELAPNTVANFIKLAQAGFYDGTKFHRVIKGFMDQGGDPLSKDDSKKLEWGTGGPGYKFADEITAGSKNNLGTVAMANSGPDTNGSQFFINAVNNNFLDGKYTVFGKVTAGLNVVEAINTTPTDSADRPTTPVIIKSVTVN
jgi:cyclophilin family peptidyl-prolyl cis-trans isomerase